MTKTVGPTESGIAPRAATILWITLAVGVLALRLHECLRLPDHTGDISRHIYYALLVAEHGLGAAGQPLSHYGPAYGGIAWADLPYNYPVVTLLFFTAMSWISPTLFFVRLSLTAVEAVNALMVGVISRDRWLALIYWAAPNSIWWISREGQFEALQSLFVFLAFLLLRRSPRLACVALALAIQVKLTAALLLPLVAWLIWRELRAKAWTAAAAFAAGFAPTALALMYYPAVKQLAYSAPLAFNPYYWNIFDRAMFTWLPSWMIATNALVSCAIIAILAVALVTHRNRQLPYLAPLLFLLVCKVHRNVQFWYMCLLPSFVLPIPDVRLRRLLFLLAPMLDLYALAMIVADRSLYGSVGAYYGAIDVFTRFNLL
jgi:hypothetical protein